MEKKLVHVNNLYVKAIQKEKHEEEVLGAFSPYHDGRLSVNQTHDSTHRQLRPRHIQLIGIGGTIGTALYVQIVCMAEMVTYLPISSPFIRFAGRYVDDAFGVAAGYNFFIFEAALVPFEIVACNVIIHYWSDAVPAGGIIAIVIVLYGLINVFAVRWYAFTFITMLGGNPLYDKFGFRFWRTPGAFTELYKTGSLGKFLGFLQCLIQASFTIAGPDYVSRWQQVKLKTLELLCLEHSMVSSIVLRHFFVLGSLAVGILVPYDDQELKDAFTNGLPGAAASPYVVAMNRLQIRILPDIVNAMVLGAAFSAGNSYWKRACDAQGLDRNKLPHKSFWQPFSAYYALAGCFIMTFVGGYTVFLPGFWDVPTFLFSYAMVGVFPIIFVGWKVIKKTKWLKPYEVVLKTQEVDEIDEHTRNYVERPPKTRWHGYVDKIFS
ncbi:hypothetical protein DID88_004209 [Monilinia fructigena]|uniref:Amino acid permease/ SLC12A domain-containing protein n=1 Tax=Monilinia fructigena TaxID=38457 RepID=A0A395IS31_9HELO|nr:hypothetical protein DID88_004209 [Monilinia fructigena]